MNAAPPLLLLLGGSFNPPHIGHLRVALEGREALGPEKTLFIPAPSPPHKPDARLLPFDMRVRMLRAAIAHLPPEWGLEVSEVENERQGPSYTIDTLEILGARHPGKRLVFTMGAEDYAQLATWRSWRNIPLLADLAIIPRKEHGLESFRRSTLSFWPGAEALPLPPDGPEGAAGDREAAPFPSRVSLIYALPGGGKSIFLPQPLLEISSSDIRERFLSGRSLDFLIPPPVRDIIISEAAALRAIWF